MRWLCLIGLAALTALVLALVGWDLITRPRDLWLAACYVAGTLAAVALGRWCRGRLK